MNRLAQALYPEAAEQMHWAGTQRVIDMRHLQKTTCAAVHKSSNEPDYDGGPRFNNVRASAYCHHAVIHVRQAEITKQ